MREIDFRTDLLPLKDKLFRLALRITLDRPEAEDVVEDVLVKVWELRHSPEIQRINNLEHYCTTMARNLAIDRAEHRNAHNLSLDDADHEAISQQHADTTLRADQQMEQHDRRRWIEQLLQLLPEKQRTILQLRDVEEHSYQEVAEIMQISDSDVKVTLFRARQALKKLVLNSPNYGL